MNLLKATPVLLITSFAACSKNPPPALAPSAVQMVRMQDIESVVFLVGDMGNALWDQSPLPRRLANEVEYWSGTLRSDSSVAVRNGAARVIVPRNGPPMRYPNDDPRRSNKTTFGMTSESRFRSSTVPPSAARADSGTSKFATPR